MSDHYADLMSGGDPSYWRGKLSSLVDNEFVAELSDYVGRTARSKPVWERTTKNPHINGALTNKYVGPSQFGGLLSLGFTGDPEVGTRQEAPYWTGLLDYAERPAPRAPDFSRGIQGQFDPSTNIISVGIPSRGKNEKFRASKQKETIIHEGLHRGLKYIRDHPELIPDDWSYVHPETGKTITASDILDLATDESEYDEEHKFINSLSQLYSGRLQSPEVTSTGAKWVPLTPAVRDMYGSFAKALDKKIREQQEWLK